MNDVGFFKEFGILLSLLFHFIAILDYNAMELISCSLCSKPDNPIGIKSGFVKLAKLPLNQVKS